MATAHFDEVLTIAEIESLEDLWAAERGFITAAEVRRVLLEDVRVDASETHLCLPSQLIQQLGLERTGSRRTTGYSRSGTADLYAAVWLTIQGRSCSMDVLEIEDGASTIIGNLVLTHLDFVIDMRSINSLATQRMTASRCTKCTKTASATVRLVRQWEAGTRRPLPDEPDSGTRNAKLYRIIPGVEFAPGPSGGITSGGRRASSGGALKWA